MVEMNTHKALAMKAFAEVDDIVAGFIENQNTPTLNRVIPRDGVYQCYCRKVYEGYYGDDINTYTDYTITIRDKNGQLTFKSS